MEETKSKELPMWVQRIQCRFGWHLWSWVYERDESNDVYVSDEPPYGTTCKRCGIHYHKCKRKDK